MKQKVIQISINNPCSEDWEQMIKKETGSYCNSCAQIVTDFTKFTDDEIIAFFYANKSKKVCGRVAIEKTNVPIYATPKHGFRHYIYKLIAVFGLGVGKLKAQQLQDTSKKSDSIVSSSKARADSVGKESSKSTLVDNETEQEKKDSDNLFNPRDKHGFREPSYFISGEIAIRPTKSKKNRTTKTKSSR